MMAEIFNLISKDHCIYQKINYLKAIFFKKSQMLKYKPVIISIVSTTNCTLACDMCPTHSRIVPGSYKWRQNASKDIDFELFKKVVDMFKEAITVHIIGAGEPMLNKDFFRMVDYASRQKKMEVKSFTNGTIIKENIEHLLNSGLSGLTVSINGHNEKEFSRMTGMPNSLFTKIYQDTRELIRQRNIKNQKLKINFSFIIDKINYKFLPEMVKFSEDLDIDCTFFCGFLPCIYEGLTPKERVIMKTDSEIIKFIKNFKGSSPVHKKHKFSFPLAIDNEMKENNCDVHFKQIRVDGDGNVSSCSMMLLNMEDAGNIRDKDPWNCQFLIDMRKRFLDNLDLEELCYSCPDNKGVEIK